MTAAITDTFRLAGTEPRPDDISPGNEDEAACILAHAVPVILGGNHRLRLTNEARADLLGRVMHLKEFRNLLDSLVAEDSDEENFDEISGDPARQANAWLRSFLAAEAGDIHQSPHDELRAALTARESLPDFALPPGTPTLDEIRRALSYAELLEPLRILIGASGGWEGRPASDRFAGRGRELERLRSFVDELASESLRESFTRGVARNVDAAAGLFGKQNARLLTVIARGGLGKSALIAKFVLQHAVRHGGADNVSRHAFPFAYIDFDRATVHTAEPQILTLEVIRQLAMQYPAAGEALVSIAESLRSELKGHLTQGHDAYAELRKTLRTYANVGPRRFLLVLDTFEVVQYDPRAIEAIDGFLSRLIGEEGFPELRIVIAGREELSTRMLFLAKASVVAPLSLPPLDISEATAMANQLGESLFRKSEWQSRWGARIAGRADDLSDRREPLSIRVAVDLLKSEDPGAREQLSLELEEKGEAAHASFVGLLYERRVLAHVRGGFDVGKLAWPGLVFRNVTEELVRTVLAPLCGISSEAAANAFELLKNEVWLVDVVEEPEGTVLRHKRELRARTLPLMRRYMPPVSSGGPPPVAFEDVNRRAIEHFGARSASPAARAEWIYHRLLAGESPKSVDKDWDELCRTRLADAVLDFRADDPAYFYLLSRTAERLVTPAKLVDMIGAGAWIALEHVERVAPDLGSFDDQTVRPELLELSNPDLKGNLTPAAEAVRRTILAKAGSWNEPPPAVVLDSPWAPQAEFARRYVRARCAFYHGTEADAYPATSPILPSEAYGLLAQDLAFAALTGASNYQEIDEQLALCLEDMRMDALRLDRGALRVAAIFGQRCSAPAARLWVRTGGSSLTCSAAELRVIANTLDRSFITKILPDRERLILGALDREGPLRIENLQIVRLLRAAWEEQNISDLSIRQFFSQRREDWTTVFGYACTRAIPVVDTGLLKDIKRRLYQYASHLRRNLLQRTAWNNRAPAWDKSSGADFIALMRIADEASDLPGMARLIASSPSATDTRDLERLIKAEKDWSDHIAFRMNLGMAEGARSQERPPRPGPILVPDDPQKGRWGGMAEREGRRLSANLTDTKSSRRTFLLDLAVSSTDGSKLEPPVVFHLHHSFPRSVIHIRRVQDGRQCVLWEVQAWGAFTVGAQVRRSDGEWIGLEFDLAELEDLPERFRGR